MNIFVVGVLSVMEISPDGKLFADFIVSDLKFINLSL